MSNETLKDRIRRLEKRVKELEKILACPACEEVKCVCGEGEWQKR